jgi:predicted metalloprotease with PDZ domain
LQLVAHEYLHQWNVRRLRPQELSPYSYGGAVIVPTLWFAEGVTSYFDSLVVYRAGLCSKEELLAEWAEQISRYLTTPGRRVQSLLESSEEAWVKLYRRDAHSDNQQVSYYLKGQLLALLLDLHLRAHGASLEQLLQQLWRNFGSTGRGYSTEDLFDAIGGFDPQLAQLCAGWLASTAELPLASYLQTVGLLLTAQASDQASTGLQLELVGRELRVRRVDRHSPAEQAGLAPVDELLALDGERLRSCEQWEQGLRPEGEHQLLFCRDGLVRTSVLWPAAPQPRHWQLLTDSSAPAAAAQLRSKWLGLPQS